MKVQRILETALYVDDLHAAEAFYSHILGLEVFLTELPRHVFFRCGDGMLLLFNSKETLQDNHLPPHGAKGTQHLAFSVPEEDLENWRLHLEENGVAIMKDMHWPNGARSLYFSDPAGHDLELTSPRLWNLE
jgi:catechol-2,3-dioxygenase